MDGTTDQNGSGAASGGLLRSTAAGAGAALAGAVLWMIFVQVTGYEVGIVAVGIGFLVGQAMAATAGTSTRLPPIGAVLSLIGCLLGQVLTDAHLLAEAVGVGTGRALQEMVTNPAFGWDVFTTGFSPIDLLFWVIAGYEGYKLTARAVAQRQAARSAPPQPPVADYFPPAGTPAAPSTDA
ncbi:MAG TPA: hypothetical protein VLL08_33160 [Kineosporiaceae bacterium]|nr:hypothetical protein [Kineosporiaceae bacterium]